MATRTALKKCKVESREKPSSLCVPKASSLCVPKSGGQKPHFNKRRAGHTLRGTKGDPSALRHQWSTLARRSTSLHTGFLASHRVVSHAFSHRGLSPISAKDLSPALAFDLSSTASAGQWSDLSPAELTQFLQSCESGSRQTLVSQMTHEERLRRVQSSPLVVPELLLNPFIPAPKQSRWNYVVAIDEKNRETVQTTSLAGPSNSTVRRMSNPTLQKISNPTLQRISNPPLQSIPNSTHRGFSNPTVSNPKLCPPPIPSGQPADPQKTAPTQNPPTGAVRLIAADEQNLFILNVCTPLKSIDAVHTKQVPKHGDLTETITALPPFSVQDLYVRWKRNGETFLLPKKVAVSSSSDTSHELQNQSENEKDQQEAARDQNSVKEKHRVVNTSRAVARSWKELFTLVKEHVSKNPLPLQTSPNTHPPSSCNEIPIHQRRVSTTHDSTQKQQQSNQFGGQAKSHSEEEARSQSKPLEEEAKIQGLAWCSYNQCLYLLYGFAVLQITWDLAWTGIIGFTVIGRVPGPQTMLPKDGPGHLARFTLPTALACDPRTGIVYVAEGSSKLRWIQVTPLEKPTAVSPALASTSSSLAVSGLSGFSLSSASLSRRLQQNDPSASLSRRLQQNDPARSLPKRKTQSPEPQIVQFEAVVHTLAGLECGSETHGLVVDHGGHLWFSNTFSHTVTRVAEAHLAHLRELSTVLSSSGEDTENGTNRPATLKASPKSLPLDAIFVFGKKDQPEYSDHIKGRHASFNRPMGLCVDACGNILVADYGNACVRRISCHHEDMFAVTTLASDREANQSGQPLRATVPGVTTLAVDARCTLFATSSTVTTGLLRLPPMSFSLAILSGLLHSLLVTALFLQDPPPPPPVFPNHPFAKNNLFSPMSLCLLIAEYAFPGFAGHLLQEVPAEIVPEVLLKWHHVLQQRLGLEAWVTSTAKLPPFLNKPPDSISERYSQLIHSHFLSKKVSEARRRADAIKAAKAQAQAKHAKQETVTKKEPDISSQPLTFASGNSSCAYHSFLELIAPDPSAPVDFSLLALNPDPC